MIPPDARGPTLDAHLHIWDLGRGGYRWITPDLGPLHATIPASRAVAELRAAGVARAVLVQADDSVADTDLMLAAAREQDRVAGVVGWVPLDDPERAGRRLDDAAGTLCGVRQLIHDDPRTGLLRRPAVRDTLRTVAGHGLAFDVPDAFPAILADVPDLADAIPRLTVVVDHLGKPPADPAGLPRWRRLLAAVAARPNTVAKLSGLQHLPDPSPAEVVDTALELFGPHRLMWGSDWPMTLDRGGYPATVSRTLPLVEGLGPGERYAVLGGTAERVYRLPRETCAVSH